MQLFAIAVCDIGESHICIVEKSVDFIRSLCHFAGSSHDLLFCITQDMRFLTADIVDIALVYGQFRLFLIELLQSLIRDGENLRLSKRQSTCQSND